MSLITGTKLAKSYGPQDVFTGLTVAVPHGARIAIVGPNGVGKTTLLRLLAGVEAPSAGAIHQARGLTAGYLPQEAAFAIRSHVAEALERTVWEECLLGFAHLREREDELRALEEAMANPEASDEALAKYGKLLERFEHEGGYTYETRIRQVLTGLGFAEEDFHKQLKIFSGGQKTRALLAGLLLEDPQLLILDEPTNHLDIEAVEWLEAWLKDWDGAAVIVSHDRYFLDKVANGIWEMTGAGIEVYRGNYSAYAEQREERQEQREQVLSAEKERLAKEMDYIRRNIAGQNVSQAKGKLRRVSRQLEALEKGGVRAAQGKWSELSSELDISGRALGVNEAFQRIRSLRTSAPRARPLRLNLETRVRSGDRVIETEALEVGYADDGKILFRSPDLLLWRGECAALIGPNGAGKTTFLKTLLGEIPPLSGKVKLGASLKVGYFAQAHAGLNPERTVLEEVMAGSDNLKVKEARDFLARFLFSGNDDIHKPIKVLSGGERGRVALARLALQGANLLLLDEPTNHLDIASREVLEEVLAEFPGTILLVSHDRYLIDRLGTQIWEVLPDQATLKTFRGSYSEYVAEKGKEKEREKGKEKEREKAIRENGRGKKPKESAKPNAEERKRAAQARKLESEVARLEARLAELSRELESAGSNVAHVRELGEQYAEVEGELVGKMREWESLQNDE